MYEYAYLPWSAKGANAKAELSQARVDLPILP
eukprot:SAG31_NODE_1748_length_7363_cov_288.231553_7_plen_32_part_00